MVTLWLAPPDSERSKLQTAMTLAQPSDKGSGQSYPRFDPHITLASLPSSIDITASQIKSWLVGLAPLEVDFKSIDIGDHFYRSVYIALDPPQKLSDLHSRVHDALGIEPRTPCFPHLSLCYITDEDAENGARENFFHQLKLRRSDHNALELNCGSEEWISRLECEEIWVVSCEGPVEQWIVLDKVTLGP